MIINRKYLTQGIDKLKMIWTLRSNVINIEKFFDESSMEFFNSYNGKVEELIEFLNEIPKFNKKRIIKKLISFYKRLMNNDHLSEHINELMKESFLTKKNTNHFRFKTMMSFSYNSSNRILDILNEQLFNLKKLPNFCNCKLKQKLGLEIHEKPNQNLEFIMVSDEYHNCDLYKCTECLTYWINDQYCDDGGSRGWRKLMYDYEFKLIK